MLQDSGRCYHTTINSQRQNVGVRWSSIVCAVVPPIRIGSKVPVARALVPDDVELSVRVEQEDHLALLHGRAASVLVGRFRGDPEANLVGGLVA